MRIWTGLGSLLAALAASAAGAGTPHPTDTPLLTAADGTAWSLDPSSVSPLALGRPGVYQFWISGDAPPARMIQQWKVRVYLYCPSLWFVPSLVTGLDAKGTVVTTTMKGWAARNWVSARSSEVILKAAKVVCPAA